MGAAWGPFRDVLKVWDEYFARKPYKAHSMGIASAPLLLCCRAILCMQDLLVIDLVNILCLLADDKVEHLAWRLRHGELPIDKAHHPKIVILHAGTNGGTSACSSHDSSLVHKLGHLIAPDSSAPEALVGGADIAGNCTADLGVKVADDYQEILDFMRAKLPNTHVVIMAILPKARGLLRAAAPCVQLSWQCTSC